MADESDGGGRPNDDPDERADGWEDLTPAVRPASDGSAGPTENATDPTEDAATDGSTDEPGAATDAAADGSDASTGSGRWDDLTPAVRRVDGDGEDWGWNDDDIQTIDESELGDNLVAGDPPEGETEAATVTGEGPPDPAGGDLSMDAPESDVEQPLAVHVEEMVKRLAIVIAVAGLVSVVVFPLTEQLINTIWNQVLPGSEAVDPRVYHPLELIFTQLKVASLAGLVVAMPVFVYETYAFMRPGLYQHERRYYLAAVPTSLVLAVVGVLFSYFLVLPYSMGYFQGYTQGTADVAFALGTTFNLILMVMGYLAVVFQIPLFIMLAIMLGVVTRHWLEDRRLLFWGAFAGIAFTFSAFDPTGVVPVIVAITMIALFEATLLLLRWTGN